MSPSDTTMKGGLYFVTLGGTQLEAEAQAELDLLASKGWQWAANPEEAELIYVHSCAYITRATETSIDLILELAALRAPGTLLAVGGELARRYGPDLQQALPEIDHLIPDIASLAQLPAPRHAHPPKSWHLSPPASLTLKVSEGCDRRCHFCVVPLIHGPHRSVPLPTLIAQVRHFLDAGGLEVQLSSYDLGAYGTDLGLTDGLLTLIDALLALDGLHWLRLTGLHPTSVTDGLLARLRDDARLTRTLHMPIEHLSQPVLAALGRTPSEAELRHLIAHMHAQVPDLHLLTDIIVGHPAESEDDFARLLAFVREGHFSHVEVHPFSPEEGTVAATATPLWPEATIDARVQALEDLNRLLSAERLLAYEGTDLEILVEGVSEETELLWQGRAHFQPRGHGGLTYINEGHAEPGALAMAEIVQTGDCDLVARILDEDEELA